MAGLEAVLQPVSPAKSYGETPTGYRNDVKMSSALLRTLPGNQACREQRDYIQTQTQS